MPRLTVGARQQKCVADSSNQPSNAVCAQLSRKQRTLQLNQMTTGPTSGADWRIGQLAGRHRYIRVAPSVAVCVANSLFSRELLISVGRVAIFSTQSIRPRHARLLLRRNTRNTLSVANPCLSSNQSDQSKNCWCPSSNDSI
uniref:Uncharacterized protein n=1 Tax=Plectus sambesii TaxID=2011161 RepID=A0A914USI8_9BILA